MATSPTPTSPRRNRTRDSVYEFRTIFHRSPPAVGLPVYDRSRDWDTGGGSVRGRLAVPVGFALEQDLARREYILFSIYNQNAAIPYELVQDSYSPQDVVLESARDIMGYVDMAVRRVLCDMSIACHGRIQALDMEALGYTEDDRRILQGVSLMCGTHESSRFENSFGLDPGRFEQFRTALHFYERQFPHLRTADLQFLTSQWRYHRTVHLPSPYLETGDPLAPQRSRLEPRFNPVFASSQEAMRRFTQELSSLPSAFAPSQAAMRTFAEEVSRLTSVSLVPGSALAALLDPTPEPEQKPPPKAAMSPVKLRKISRTFAGIEVDNLSDGAGTVDRRIPQLEVKSGNPLKSISLRRFRGKPPSDSYD